MQMPDINANPTRRRWDHWRSFHVCDGPFTDFESGECIWTDSEPAPDLRRMYRQRNVQIVSTADAECPRLYLPGETTAIPAAWLNSSGQQIVAIDYDFNKVVRLMMSSYHVRSNASDWAEMPVPHRFRGRCAVYWGGPGCEPVGTSLTISRPNKISADEKAYLQALRDQAAAWAAMMGADLTSWSITLPDRSRGTFHQKPVPASRLLGKTFADLSLATRGQLHVHGYVVDRVSSQVPYLVVKP